MNKAQVAEFFHRLAADKKGQSQTNLCTGAGAGVWEQLSNRAKLRIAVRTGDVL